MYLITTTACLLGFASYATQWWGRNLRCIRVGNDPSPTATRLYGEWSRILGSEGFHPRSLKIASISGIVTRAITPLSWKDIMLLEDKRKAVHLLKLSTMRENTVRPSFSSLEAAIKYLFGCINDGLENKDEELLLDCFLVLEQIAGVEIRTIPLFSSDSTAVDYIMHCLKSSSHPIRVVCAKLLETLTRTEHLSALLAEDESYTTQLFDALVTSDPRLQKPLLFVILYVGVVVDGFKCRVDGPSVLPSVLSCLVSSEVEVQVYAAAVLHDLAIIESNRLYIINSEAISFLMTLLRTRVPGKSIDSICLTTLAYLSASSTARHIMAGEGIIKRALEFVYSATEDLRFWAVVLVHELAQDASIAAEVVSHDGSAVLVRVLHVSSRKQTIDVVLDTLYRISDSAPSSKAMVDDTPLVAELLRLLRDESTGRDTVYKIMCLLWSLANRCPMMQKMLGERCSEAIVSTLSKFPSYKRIVYTAMGVAWNLCDHVPNVARLISLGVPQLALRSLKHLSDGNVGKVALGCLGIMAEHDRVLRLLRKNLGRSINDIMNFVVKYTEQASILKNGVRILSLLAAHSNDACLRVMNVVMWPMCNESDEKWMSVSMIVTACILRRIGRSGQVDQFELRKYLTEGLMDKLYDILFIESHYSSNMHNVVQDARKDAPPPPISIRPTVANVEPVPPPSHTQTKKPTHTPDLMIDALVLLLAFSEADGQCAPLLYRHKHGALVTLITDKLSSDISSSERFLMTHIRALMMMRVSSHRLGFARLEDHSPAPFTPATPFICINGMSIRNDSIGFETAMAPSLAKSTGKYCYHVEVHGDGIAQIGWCTLDATFSAEIREIGVGDDVNSVGFDGARGLVWHARMSTQFGDTWHVGSIVSCCIDFDQMEVKYVLDGVDLGSFPLFCLKPLCPGMSLDRGQQLEVIGGHVDGYENLCQ